MKRRELIRHLQRHGCQVKREGREHSLWHNPATFQMQAVPRHTEISNLMAKKICRALSIPDPC